MYTHIYFNGFPVGIPTFKFQYTSKFFRPTFGVCVLVNFAGVLAKVKIYGEIERGRE